MAGRLITARQDVDRQIRSVVEDVNSIAERIASLNQAIAAASPETSLHMLDDQMQLVRNLSEFIGINVLVRPEGGVDISVANGRPLVLGNTALDVTVTNIAADGFAVLGMNGATFTSETVIGGKLGGLLQLRDVNIPTYQDRLDHLAYNVANQINAFHSAGYDEMGAAAGDLLGFSKALVGVAGAAAALTVDAAVAAASRLVAAAAVANGGDNRNARAIAALREQKVLNGNTASLSDSWAELVYRVGRDTKAATDEARSRAQIVAQVDALRDQVSGISLDEEAMNLLKFQRAYEANGFFSAIDRTIALMMKYLGR